jgi:hypothetical protein
MHPQGPNGMATTERFIADSAEAVGADRVDFDGEWFLEGERTSSPPPSSRTPKTTPTVPAPPIGDPFADEWFR